MASSRTQRWFGRVAGWPLEPSGAGWPSRADTHLRIMQQAQAWADACEHDYARASDSCGPAGDLFFVLQAHRHHLCSGVYGKHIMEGLWRVQHPVRAFGWTHPDFV